MAASKVSKPNNLSVVYIDADNNTPSNLTKPYGLSFEFSAEAGGNITVAPNGLVATEFGLPSLVFKQTITVNGFLSSTYGQPSVDNKTQKITSITLASQLKVGALLIHNLKQIQFINGFDSSLYGTAVVSKPPVAYLNGFDSLVMGSTTVSHRIKNLRTTGHDSSVFGTGATVTHGVREVIANGFTYQGYGNAWVSHGIRYVEPIGIYQVNATNHTVGGTRWLEPTGFIATEFGTRIIPEIQNTYPQGIAGEIGLPTIYLSTQHIKPAGFISVGQQPADRWGRQTVFNSTQYIQQEYDGNSGLVPPKWSDWQSIENRNKVSVVSGFYSQRFGYTKIDNNAEPLLPQGIAPPAAGRYDVSMVSHRIRYIKLEGIEAPPVSSWVVAYNGARIIAPVGVVHTQIGNASAVNTRRYYRNYGRIDSLEMGVPTIGYAIRTIDIESRYGIMPPQINLPTVDLYTRYIDCTGYETAAYGLPSLSVHFNIIGPSWRHRNNVGEPAVRNVTPELGIYGHDSSEFGRASVRTQWRTVQTQGDRATLFGLAAIADTRRVIAVRGWRDTTISQKHLVTKTGSPPYSQQIISLDGYYDIDNDKAVSGFGIYFNEQLLGPRIPKPSLNQNVIYPASIVASAYGNAKVTSNVIRIISGIDDSNVSTGAMVSNKNRTITIADGIDNAIVVGEPSLSPHTIYAVREAPEQAKRNHKYQDLHYVNETKDYPPGARFGYPNVESTIRVVAPKGASSSIVGTPKAELFKRYLRPRGFKRSLFGIPSIPFVPQYLSFERTNNLMSLYGKPVITVSDYGPKEIKATGIDSLVIGSLEAQLKTRYILTAGHNSQAMGTKKDNDQPFMWQGLRIGEHVPLIIGGDDMSKFGSIFISHRVRNLELQGFDAFVSEYDINNFGGRMKIAHANISVDDTQYINTDGFVSSQHSNHAIRLNTHFIRPDGNSDQFRKGAF